MLSCRGDASFHDCQSVLLLPNMPTVPLHRITMPIQVAMLRRRRWRTARRRRSATPWPPAASSTARPRCASRRASWCCAARRPSAARSCCAAWWPTSPSASASASTTPRAGRSAHRPGFFMPAVPCAVAVVACSCRMDAELVGHLLVIQLQSAMCYLHTNWTGAVWP